MSSNKVDFFLSECLKKESKPQSLKLILDLNTQCEHSLLPFEGVTSDTICIHEYLSSLSQKPNIIPKFYGNSEEGLLFQPMKKSLKSHLKELSQLPFKEFWSLYKTLLNGLAFLQTLRIFASGLSINTVFMTENNEIKVVFCDKTDNMREKVLDFAHLILNIVHGEWLESESTSTFQKKEELEKFNKRGFGSNFVQTTNLEEKKILEEITEKLKELLWCEKNQNFDFIQLFLHTLKYKSPENLKKMIFIEETHGLEISYDLLVRKDSLKFELNESNTMCKIFGVSSLPIEKKWENVEELKNALEEIKPIKSLNLLVSSPNSSEFDSRHLEVLDAISTKKLFRLEDFKTLIIQATPCKSLVKDSHWYKFLWHTFYRLEENPIENSGFGLLKEHSADWFFVIILLWSYHFFKRGKGLNPEGMNKIVGLLDKNWIKERKLERIRVVLASYYSFDQETLQNKVFNFILNLRMKKLQSLELAFEICNLNDESIFPGFLQNLGLKLKKENNDSLGVLTLSLYA